MLSLALVPLLCCLPACLWRQPVVGQLIWRRGVWEIEYSGVRKRVEVCATSTCLSWVIYFSWREPPSGRRSALWLFADSAPAEQLRQLRVRLALQR